MSLPGLPRLFLCSKFIIIIYYKRGEILKVHLGYNIGSEEGGLHYCVVLDKENSIYSPVISVAPLTSVKPWTALDKLHSKAKKEKVKN